MSQQKEIQEIERKLLALESDNSSSAMAQKAKLRAELAEKQAALDETYYDRSVSNQQTALDNELETFKEQKDAELEKWDQYLEDVETIVAESLTNIQLNADVVYAELQATEQEYNLTLSNDLQQPWVDAAIKAREFKTVYPELKEEAGAYSHHVSTTLSDAWANGKSAIDAYDEVFGDSVSYTIDQLESIKNGWQNIVDEINKAADAQIKLINNQDKANNAVQNGTGGNNGGTNNNVGNGKPNTGNQGTNSGGGTKPNTGNNSNVNNNPGTNSNTGTSASREQSEYVGVALAIWNGNHGWGTGDTRVQRLTSKGFNAKKVQELINKMGMDGYVHTSAWMKKYGITDLSQYKFSRYASGSTGVNKNQLAIIDELGEELQLVPGQNGRLEYIKKGTSILNSTMTERLMDLAMNPQDMLDRNRPVINAPHIVNNEISIDCSVGTMVHIEHCDQNTLPDVEKLVNKAFDKHMQTLNNNIRRYTR